MNRLSFNAPGIGGPANPDPKGEFCSECRRGFADADELVAELEKNHELRSMFAELVWGIVNLDDARVIAEARAIDREIQRVAEDRWRALNTSRWAA